MIKVTDSNTLDYEILCWDDIKDEISIYNPVFFKLIEKLNPNRNLKLVKAKYLYGSVIVDEGTVNFPARNQKLLPITDPNFPKELHELLNYSPIPLGMLLNKGSEVFIQINERVIPLNILKPGSFFGLFETLSLLSQSNFTPIWSVCAGAQSAFMVPKITDTISHRRLRTELGLTVDLPKTPGEHCEIFSQINKRLPDEKRWQSHVLFFTKEWIHLIQNDPTWNDFSNHLFKLGWSVTQHKVNDIAVNMLWESLAATITKRKLRPRPYLIDTVKHLISIGMGSLPGFGTVNTNEILVPSLCVQDAYINVYGLKEYMPLIVCPHTLRNSGKNVPVYYFLTYPTLLAGFPSERGTPSILMDIRDIKTIIETLEKKLPEVVHSSIYARVSHIQYNYYHTEHDKFGEISHSSHLPADNPLILDGYESFSDRYFPVNAPFMPGCIKIAIKGDNL